MAEWLKATDCKSVLSRVRRFEPCSAHSSFIVFRITGSSSIGRAIAFQAIGREFETRLPLKRKSLCSSGVEHFLGREEVVSSILTNGSALRQMAQNEFPGDIPFNWISQETTGW